MKKTTPMPLPFASKIDSILLEMNLFPLFGNAPKFDQESFQNALSNTFQKPLDISFENGRLESESHILDGMGSQILTLPIVLSPLKGFAYFHIHHKDLAEITAYFMGNNISLQSFRSETLQNGFFNYLACEILNILQTTPPLNFFSMKIVHPTDAPLDSSYCIDVKASFEKRSCYAKISLSKQLMKSFRSHFLSAKTIFSSLSLSQNLKIPIRISIGNVRLTLNEWKKIKKGDCILLQNKEYDFLHHEGFATIYAFAKELFQVSIKENKINILDYAPSNEDAMEKTDSESTDSAATEKTLSAIKELELTISVELTQFNISLEKLMQLSPGNFLELPIHLDQEVSLMINGQKMGRGELVYLGDVPGIRIIEKV